MTKHPLKKQKRVQPQTEPKDSTCHLTNLPLELLAEILLYTASPKAILSVARCSKFLCLTLLHPRNQYLWKSSRQNCLPTPLPEPCPQFTEAAFVAFVFDAGPCEICGNIVDGFKSYGLQARLCDKPDCKETFRQDKLQDRVFASNHVFEDILPVVESRECFGTPSSFGFSFISSQVWPQTELSNAVFRRSDWTLAHQKFVDASSKPELLGKFIADCQRKSAEKKAYMQMCVSVFAWRKTYSAALRDMKGINTNFSKNLAAKEGLVFWDMVQTPTYAPLLKRKSMALEKIEQSDYNLREAAIATELVKIAERRGRRTHEAGYSARRNAVEKHYNRLRALKQETPLPCLPSFRELPIIHQLQHSNQSDEKMLDKNIQSKPIQNLIRSELAKFHVEAKNSLAEILGLLNWKSPSSKKAHPAERLTAQFRCRTCQRVEAKYRESGCMDYAGVIMHQCAVTLDKSVPAKPFKASRFEKDEKAIAVITTLLKTCGIASDEKDAPKLLSAIGPRISCLSCDAQIVLEPMAVIGHSRRHESMTIALLPQDDANTILSERPLSQGLATKLLNKGSVAVNMRNQKIYTCRHCVQVKPAMPTTGGVSTKSSSETNSAASSSAGGSSSGAATKPATLDSTKSTPAAAITAKSPQQDQPPKADRKPTLYIFDGLRSHLKGLHKITDIRDEDFFCTKELEWPKK
ncbi:hypothetical protein BDP27DRAFT_1281459 [Rhodocollybia butyracea]|uniref:F-box domain-containing protein n=1 Tax=Rhodocollybia butyracea TaxID=206335 RepID=A0A9P5UH64_9AGAR|nr:hypothetical protein BDP27DRAFT_1281459 [Rhodocollybia butyracea]